MKIDQRPLNATWAVKLYDFVDVYDAEWIDEWKLFVVLAVIKINFTTIMQIIQISKVNSSIFLISFFKTAEVSRKHSIVLVYFLFRVSRIEVLVNIEKFSSNLRKLLLPRRPKKRADAIKISNTSLRSMVTVLKPQKCYDVLCKLLEFMIFRWIFGRFESFSFESVTFGNEIYASILKCSMLKCLQ